MHWQNWSYKVIYGALIFPIYALLSFRYVMTPFDLIHVNRGFSEWGLPFASKYNFLEPFKTTKQFLPHFVIHTTQQHAQAFKDAKTFMKENKLTYPIIAKPDQGVIGVGVMKITNDTQLKALIAKIPGDYLLQEYANLPYEFGVYYRRYPWQKKGKVVSLTQKNIPFVTGDGKRNVQELIQTEPLFKWNKKALLTHAHTLQHIPRKGEHFQVILQASHTYGTIFKDWNTHITKQMSTWVDAISQKNPCFYYGRFDIKFPNLESLHTGKGAKLVELNGTTAEPIHMYDDKHSLWFGIRSLFISYNNAFRIAKYNKKKLKKKTPILTIIKKYKAYLAHVKRTKEVMG